MFVNNNALDTDTLSNSSTIPEINIPEIIIEQALKQKKENQQKNEKRKVYTEIVSNKFEPIAIFCMTDGSKTLNLNYQKALKLKKNYPNLKIIEIDKTLYKKDLSQEKKQLIFNVEYHISGNILNDQTDYDRYDYFFNKFLELKKTNNYTVNDIITLYKKNKEMLSVFLDFDNIFKNYDIDSIKFILLNNYKTNLKTIFNGTFRSFILKNIYDTLKNNDSNKLNEVFPGLGTFIEIFPKVNINDEIINIIKQGKKIDFSYINQILIKEIKYQQQNNLQELLNLKKQLENLKKDKIVKEEEIKKINKCNDFTNKLYLYFIVTNDIKDEKNKIEGNEFTKQILNTNLKTLEISLDNKKIELKKVQKIKIFNLSKIKKIKEELNILNTQIEQIKKEITTKNQENIVFKNNTTSFNQKFKKEVGCDIDDYLKLHSQALNFLNRQNLYLNQFELNQINNNIEKITSQIVTLEKDIKILEEIPNQNKK